MSHGPDYLRFYIILFIVVPHQAIVLASHWLTFKAALFQKRKIYVFLSFFGNAPFGMVKVRFSLNLRGKKEQIPEIEIQSFTTYIILCSLQ